MLEYFCDCHLAARPAQPAAKPVPPPGTADAHPDDAVAAILGGNVRRIAALVWQ